MKIKMLLAFALLLLSASSEAAIFSRRIDASADNIPTAYNITSKSLAIQGARNVRSIIVDNRSAVEVAVNCQGTTTTAPADASVANIYVDAETQVAIDSANLSNQCYIRSMGSAITTGVVVLMLVGG